MTTAPYVSASAAGRAPMGRRPRAGKEQLLDEGEVIPAGLDRLSGPDDVNPAARPIPPVVTRRPGERDLSSGQVGGIGVPG
jgi:hypothetical protein